MKLSVYAQKLGITYRTAWSYFQQGMIPGAYQTPTGTIIVPIEAPQHKEIVDIMKFIYDPRFLDLPGAGVHLHRPHEIVLKSLYSGTIGNQNLALSPEDWFWLKNNENAGDNHYTLEKLKHKEQCRSNGVPFRFTEMVMAVGRRSGKTTLRSLISAYEAYKLLVINNGDAHEYYNIPEEKQLHIIGVSPTLDLSTQALNDLRVHFKRSPFFASRISHDTQTSISLMSDWNLHMNANRGSINVVCGSNHKSLRGYPAVCVIFDEIDFFNEGQLLFDSLLPSVAPFNEKNSGLVVSLSSISLHKGLNGALSRRAAVGLQPQSSTLLFRMPTWVVNPDLPETCATLTEAKKINPKLYSIEFGAEWPEDI